MSAARYHRTTRARSTKALITVTHGDDYGLDTDTDGPWYTVCEDHCLLCSHETLALARSFASAPEEWCEECAEQITYSRN